MARNEAGPDRFLRRVLSRCQEFSDLIVVLDDASADATPDICREMGARVHTRATASVPAWGTEASARAELWAWASEYATDADDWVLICDADQVLVGNPRDLMRSVEVNTWSFVLYDLWSEQEYREDEFWRGHLVPRPWMFAVNRVPQGWQPLWPSRGVHPGHCPVNWPMVAGIAPPDRYHWLHYAYSTPELREQKAKQYQAIAHQLSPFEQAHANSILA